MNLKERIQAFVQLGVYLEGSFFKDYSDKIYEAKVKNAWFTEDNIKGAINVWIEQLNADTLNAWLGPYRLTEFNSSKKVLIVMAGNIPLVGLHDFLSVIILGHKAVIKLSSNDNVLMPFFVHKLTEIAPDFKDSIEFIGDVKNKKFDGVIATGTDNSAQYFEYYFKKSKKIIRKNRRSVAVLDGTETFIELQGLANDIFLYFGLGCRSVSKLFLPKGYDLNKLFEVFYPFNKVVEHKKYGNNYDYNKAIFLMGGAELVENGFLLMKEDKSLLSPVAMLYYEYYDNIHVVEQFIETNTDKLQCVVSKKDIPFGNAQKPNLWDYADGIDTIEFLREL